MRSICHLLFLLAGTILAACTSVEEPDAESTGDGSGNLSSCFVARQASNWDVLDRSNLIVYAPNQSNAFRVQISPPSMELRSAQALAFSGRSSRICGFAGDQVVVGRGRSGRTHSVINVLRLDERELENLQRRFGKLPADESAPVPEESPGAEVTEDVAE